MNVSVALTKEYENKSNWAICENEPKRTQNKAKQTQFQSQYMLLRMKINPRRVSLCYYADEIEAPNAYYCAGSNSFAIPEAVTNEVICSFLLKISTTGNWQGTTRGVVITTELPQKEPLRQYTTLHLTQDEDAGNEIYATSFRFGFPKGLLCLIVNPNLDAWQFAGRVNVM